MQDIQKLYSKLSTVYELAKNIRRNTKHILNLQFKDYIMKSEEGNNVNVIELVLHIDTLAQQIQSLEEE